MNSFLRPVFLGLLLLGAVVPPRALRAEEKPPAEASSGDLSLPWDDFRKLLKMDSNDITLSLEEFQKLVRQTGVSEAPPHHVKDGNVILSRKEFRNLLDRMKAPAGDAKWFLTRAVYEAEVGPQGTSVTARFRLQIPLEKGSIAPQRVPLFPGVMAFRDIQVDGKPALVESAGPQTFVTVLTPGDHDITATFSTSANTTKAPYQLNFAVPQTPITILEAVIPVQNVDVKVAQASQTEVSTVKGKTRVRALLPSLSFVDMTWNPVVPEKAKGPAKVYAVSHHFLSIEENALKATLRLELEVMQNTVNAVNLRVPEGYSVLDVQGEAVGDDWKVRGEGAEAVLVVPFTFARQGAFPLTITAEKSLKDSSEVVSYGGFDVLDAVREKGYFGVGLVTTAEVKVTDTQGLDRQDPQELPGVLQRLCPRPLLYGFKYVRPPFSATLDIQRHKEVAVVSTVVDEANGVSLLLKDGKRVHQVTYSVRNTWKQFLEIVLPEGAQVWSAFVEGVPVKPSRNDQGKILIPLNRSVPEGQGLSSFDVEVMYFESGGKPGPAGRESFSFPAPDVVVSQILWSVYLPENWDALYFGGDMEKEESVQGFRALANVLTGRKHILRDLGEEAVQYADILSRSEGRYKEGKQERLMRARGSSLMSQAKSTFDASQALSDQSMERQVERELNFFSRVQQQSVQSAAGQGGGGDAGTLPIRVSVPNQGQVYRFTKRIVVDAAPVPLTVVFFRTWLTSLLMVLLGLLGVSVLWRVRGVFQKGASAAAGFFRAHPALRGFLLSPPGGTLISFLLAILLSFVSPFLTVLAFIALMIFGLRWGWTVLERSRGGRP